MNVVTVERAHAATSAPPDGYARVTTAQFEIVAQRAIVDAMQRVLAAHGSLYEWAAGLPQPHALRGRAPVYVAELPGTGAVLAVRHAWHGGMLAPLTGDRFRPPTRAPVELANSLRLSKLGVPTTEMLGYVLYPAGPALRRVDVASRFIADAADFGAVLAARAPAVRLRDAMPAVVDLLVKLARDGVRHPDLNVKNILLARDAGDVLHARVIDVDVIRFDSELSPVQVMEANLRRLVRSIRKWRERSGVETGDDVIAALERQCRVALDGASA
jgi:3-deoxy-D-manno-octulosonic acid kinase